MPIKQIKIHVNKKKASKPWITKGILKSIAHKSKMYKALKISDDKSIEKEYKLFKNK